MVPSTGLADRAVRRVARRLVPFLLLMYVLAFLDRVNIGFAKEAFQADTGLSDAAYAFGAGVFFIGYALVEVPSNLALHRFGARRWLARIMITWGLISAAMAFAHTETVFYLLRFLLGVAEAGFFPGVILYLTYWVPERHRARVNGLFYFGAPLAFIFGGPVSGALLELDGVAGIIGWQWMFLVEGLAASVVGVWALRYLDDRPRDARWLPADQRDALETELAAEERGSRAHGPSGVLATLRSPRVLYLALIYLLIQMSVYGVSFYLPTQVAELLGTEVGVAVGVVTAIPWLCAIAASFGIGRLSDRTGDRRRIAAVTLAVAGLGIAGSVVAGTPALAMVGLCFAAAGFIAVQPVFWTLPAGILVGTAAATGIGMVNALGSLGGFIAPNIKQAADTGFGSGQAGLYVLAVTTLVGAVLIWTTKWLRPATPAPAAGTPVARTNKENA
ncbi:MFS transporter [Prauserella endophytica]|nr:MFS transporter [Prauserella endophytica]